MRFLLCAGLLGIASGFTTASGLIKLSPSTSLTSTTTPSSALNKVAVVPRKLVLNVPFSDNEDDIISSSNGRSWDTNLSCKLWEECQKGKDSVYYG